MDLRRFVGPDTGKWFTRFPGFPGHSPQEFESALKMGYLMGPTHLFVENIDVLLRHKPEGFMKTEFGEVWLQFVRKFIPENPLTWHHAQADPDIAVIHSDDSNYGQNERLLVVAHFRHKLSLKAKACFTFGICLVEEPYRLMVAACIYQGTTSRDIN